MYARTRAQGFGPEVKRRIMLGTYVLSAGYYDAYYLKAQQVRTLILRDYEQAFQGDAVDVIAMPTSPTPAFKIGERVADPLQMYLADVFTVSANLAGLPAVSVPCGFTSGTAADRPAAHGTPVRRSHAAPHRRRLRARHRMVARSSPASCPSRPSCPPASPMTDWATLSDEQLLDVRMCDLGLTIEGTDLEARIAQLNAELDARGLTFRPHYWLSDEWFTPDGVPGIAIPFYLAHPRLAKLELAQMLEVEGGDPESCLRILRHEAGHAIDNAYALRRRPTRRRLFGNPGSSIPSTTRRSRTARASSSISITGTRRAIPTKTSPRRSPSGSTRTRCGRRATPAGRRSASSNTWIA